MPLSQHNHVIQALASDGAHQPFRKRILPRAPRCRQDFGDVHISEPRRSGPDLGSNVVAPGRRGTVARFDERSYWPQLLAVPRI